MRRARILVLAVSVEAFSVATATAPMLGSEPYRDGIARDSSHYCAQVYWRTGRDGDQRCPASHSIIADISYTNLRWTRWTGTQADGHGDNLAFDDAPGPRPGSIVQALTIKLTHARHCSDGRWIYTRSTATLNATRRTIALKARVPLMPAKGRIENQIHQSYGCNPKVGSDG